jgi:DUF4097 and DUF4098 domain-containing protein YvlB
VGGQEAAVRRQSLAGPIVLIALGIIFLVNNIHPDLSLWRMVRLYWPFIVIGFGVIRLAEVLIDFGQGRGATPYHHRGGGGVWVLLAIGFVFYGISANRNGLVVRNWNGGAVDIFGEQFDYPISAKGSAAGVSMLVLDNIRGNVTVTGDDGDEYSAEGRRTVRAFNRSEADDSDRRTALKFLREGNQLIVRTDERDVPSNRRLSADMDLKVPRGVSVQARGRSGDLSVNSIGGSVDISSDRGDVRLSEIGGNAKISLKRSGLVRAVDVKGSVDVDGKGSDVQIQNITGESTVNGSFSGTLEFKGLTGPLHFESPQSDMRVEKLPGSLTLDLSDLRANGIVGPMRVRTKSRDVHVEDFTDSLDLDLGRGDIEVSTTKVPVGKIDVHTNNGNIELALPAKAVFDLKATSRLGEAHNDFGPGVKMEIENRSASLRSVSGSGPSVTASTDRGTLSIRKSN